MSFLDKEFNNFDGNYLKLLDYISEIDVRISKLENSKSRENLQNELTNLLMKIYVISSHKIIPERDYTELRFGFKVLGKRLLVEENNLTFSDICAEIKESYNVKNNLIKDYL